MSAIKPTYEELAQRVKSLESKLKDCLNVEDVPKESDEGYRSIVEVAPGAIMAIRNGYFLFVNPAGARMLGFSDPEEMVGMPVLDVVAPESQEVVAERIKRLESGKDNLPIKIALISQNGMRVPMESTSTSIPIGGISTAVIFARDISDQKQRETNRQQLLMQKQSFDELLSNISRNFLAIPIDQVEKEFPGAVQSITRHEDIDRCSLGTFSETEGMFRITADADEISTYTLPKGAEYQVPWFQARLKEKKLTYYSTLDELPEEAAKDRNWLAELKIESMVAIPLTVGGVCVGGIGFEAVGRSRRWSEEEIDKFSRIAEVFANTLARQKGDRELRAAFSEIRELKDRLEQENIFLREEIEIKHHKIVGKSDAIKKILSQAEMVARQDTTALLLGETGTGKELLAHAIHNTSLRENRAMVTVNCVAIPSTLIESELFGREKGAFTGAMAKQIGRFEIADCSTIFLDEIAELSPEIQVKLLRVLQDGTFERLGSPKTIAVDVRVIAATNRNLARAVQEGKFREDLYYRLNVFPITVPTLRERAEDIEALVWFFVGELGEKMGRFIKKISPKSMEVLKNYHWPGNVRELRNVVERSLILNNGTTLELHLPTSLESEPPENLELENVERQHIINILKQTNWRVKGKGGAAEILCLNPSTLRFRMKKLGIERP
ncbi:MAG: sigma 54-interacting transcriptional regulator [Deltaproteobacteria bacterium]|nr:sigma 54-interacting transcriptional regulator [Deltaproteobacteria bacterium]